MKPNDSTDPTSDGLEAMTVDVRTDPEGGCLVDIGGDDAVMDALETRAREEHLSVEELVLAMVREGLASRRRREK